MADPTGTRERLPRRKVIHKSSRGPSYRELLDPLAPWMLFRIVAAVLPLRGLSHARVLDFFAQFRVRAVQSKALLIFVDGFVVFAVFVVAVADRNRRRDRLLVDNRRVRNLLPRGTGGHAMREIPGAP